MEEVKQALSIIPVGAFAVFLAERVAAAEVGSLEGPSLVLMVPSAFAAKSTHVVPEALAVEGTHVLMVPVIPEALAAEGSPHEGPSCVPASRAVPRAYVAEGNRPRSVQAHPLNPEPLVAAPHHSETGPVLEILAGGYSAAQTPAGGSD